MTNELPAGEEADLIEYLNHGHKRVTEYLDLVRRWDSIPYDARDPTHPQYSQRVLLLGSYLNWSHTRTWAWDGMQNLLAELQRRREPIPEIISIWAYQVALEKLTRPERGRGRKSEWNRNARMVSVLRILRNGGYSWEQAIKQIADWTCLSFDAVKIAVRNHKRDRPFSPNPPKDGLGDSP